MKLLLSSCIQIELKSVISLKFYTYVGFRAKRDLREFRINNEKRDDKRFMTLDCEYIANEACDLRHDCITSEAHVLAPFRRLLRLNATLFEEVTASYGNGMFIVAKRRSVRSAVSPGSRIRRR